MGRIWRDDDLCEHPTAYNMDGTGTCWHSDDIIEVSDSSRYPIFEGLIEVRCDDIGVFYAPNIIYESYSGGEAVYFKLLANPPPNSSDWEKRWPRAAKMFIDAGISFQNAKMGPYGRTTYTSTKDGVWSDTTVWGGGPPGTGDSVVCNNNITLDVAAVCADINIAAGKTFDTDSTGNYSFTTDAGATAFSYLYGTMNCNGSTISLRSGATAYAIYVVGGGVFNGGSGTHTIASFFAADSTTITLSSGTVTFNGVISTGNNISLGFGGTTTWSHGSGTVVLAYPGTQLLYSHDYVSYGFNNLIVNDASCAAGFSPSYGWALSLAGNLTITTGTFDTTNGGALTVTGDAIVTGTLTSPYTTSVRSMTISASTGVFSAPGATTTITGRNGSNVAWSNSHTFTHNNGKVDFTGQAGTATYDIKGDTTWYDLEVSTTAATSYRFENGKTQTISHSTTLKGATGQLLTLNSVSGAASWAYTITAGMTQTQQYLHVAYSNAGGGDKVVANDGTTVNGGHNTNWDFGDVVWSAAANDDWSTNAAWSSGVKPAVGKSVVFDSTSVYNCTVDEASASLLSFTIASGYTGTITMSHVISVAGNVSIAFGSGGAFAGASSLTITDTATVDSNSSIPLLTINATARTITQDGAVTAANLDITAGTYDTDATNHYALTTTNACNVSDTLNLNASTVSCTGTGTVATYAIETPNGGGGVINMGSATVSVGSIGFYSTSTSTLTSGTLTITTNGTGIALGFHSVAVVNHNGGTVTFTYTGTTCMYDDSNTARAFSTVIVNGSGCVLRGYNAGGFNVTAATLTITSGTYDTSDYIGGTSRNLTVTGTSSITGTLTPNASTCTFNGVVAVNSGGVLGGNTAWTCDSNNTMTLAAGSTVHAPTGDTFTFLTFINNGGTFNHDGGTASCDVGEGYITGSAVTTFNNLKWIANGASHYIEKSIIIEGTATMVGTARLMIYVSLTITLGTSSASGTFILNNNGIWCTVAATIGIQAASASYPVVITSTADMDWDRVPNIIWNLKWLDLQFDATTGGGGCTINFTGNMTIDGFTVSAGDTLSCTVAGTTITCNILKDVVNAGTIISTGTAGNTITWSGFSQFYTATTSNTVTLSYTTIITTRNVNGVAAFQVGQGGNHPCILTVDNCIFSNVNQSGFQLATTNANYTITSSTFIGKPGALWSQQDIGVWTNCKLQLSSCTFTTVGMEATSGWLMSKTTGGVANATNFYGIASSTSMATAYQIADADNVTIKNADAYGTPFNSSLTLSAAEQMTNLTINASTTLTTNLAASYALTATGACVVTGTLTGNASAISVGSMTISASTGVYTATSGTTTVTSRNGSNVAWSNSHTFTHSNGKVDFTGQAGTNTYDIKGNNGWYDLEISTTAACTYRFENGKTQTINHSTTLTGAAGQLLTLNSVSGAAVWLYTISTGMSQTQDYLNVSYSDASGGDTVHQTNSVNGGNNVNWDFPAPSGRTGPCLIPPLELPPLANIPLR